MYLNERKVKILEAIINDYILTGEPIGSRTIAKKYDFGISSATIRNEMSDLEDLGLIIQPHASAGRVPSDKGYRLYVDRLKEYREITTEEIEFLRNTIKSNLNQMDFLVQETAKAIALLTNYTTIASQTRTSEMSVKHIQLMPLDEGSFVLTLITDTKAVRNRTVKYKNAPDYATLTKISTLINYHLENTSIDGIAPLVLDTLRAEFGLGKEFLKTLMEAISDVMHAEEEMQIFTGGVKNILGYPEFSDLDKAKAIFQALEEKEMLVTLLGDTKDIDKIQIIIGTENIVEPMKDCSLIKSNYILGDKKVGSIGIIGPTRMNYVEVVSVLNGIVKNINSVIQTLSGG